MVQTRHTFKNTTTYTRLNRKFYKPRLQHTLVYKFYIAKTKVRTEVKVYDYHTCMPRRPLTKCLALQPPIPLRPDG